MTEKTIVVITNMKHRPTDCTECPLLNEYDECQALPWHETAWDTQYSKCPLLEVEYTKRRKSNVTGNNGKGNEADNC